MESNRIIVITGASSGIGLATAAAFFDKGMVVYNLSRTTASLDGIRNITCDVTKEESVVEAFNTIREKEGKIDILVLNAGFGISGAVEETKVEDALLQFDVNFFGVARCVKAALPLLREAQKSKIIIVSSLAAAFPIPFQAYYSASKAALINYSRCLATEIAPFGIKVVSILPGDIKTNFTEKRKKSSESGLYIERSSRAVNVMEKDERNGMSPMVIGKAIYRISNKKFPHRQYTVGIKYRLLIFLSKILPNDLIDKIIKKMYS